MPLNEHKTTLPETFAQPAGQPDGPQVFQIDFEAACFAVGWEWALSKASEDLGIEYRMKKTPHENGEGCTILLGLLESSEYPRLIQAIEPYHQDYAEYMDEMTAMYEADLAAER